MRSMFFNLTSVTRQEVAAFLFEIAEANGPEAWRWPIGAESATLYIEFYDDLLAEAEDEDLVMLQEALGSLPDVSVMVDVSGRIPGGAEVGEISRLLRVRMLMPGGARACHPGAALGKRLVWPNLSPARRLLIFGGVTRATPAVQRVLLGSGNAAVHHPCVHEANRRQRRPGRGGGAVGGD